MITLRKVNLALGWLLLLLGSTIFGVLVIEMNTDDRIEWIIILSFSGILAWLTGIPLAVMGLKK